MRINWIQYPHAQEVDMTPVIELLKTYDKQFREFTITGTKTDKDDNLVSVRESPYWRLQKGTERTRLIPMSDVSDVLGP